jgi:Lon protease-like protein
VRPELPLFPLGTVLFPGLVLPLHVFEPRYRTLVGDLLALPEDVTREFGVVAIRKGWEVAGPDETSESTSASLTLYEVGCTAELRRSTELPDGRFEIVTVGRRRFRITDIDAVTGPYLRASVSFLPDDLGDASVADRLAGRVLAAFQRYLSLVRGPDQPGEQVPEDPAVLSYLVAATTTLSLEDRQHLLATPDTVGRLRSELALLNRETALLGELGAAPADLSDLNAPSPSPN